MLPEIFGTPTYFIYLSFLFSLMAILLPWWTQKNYLEIQHAYNMAILIMIFGFIGARVTHIFYEAPNLYQQHPMAVFQFWYGGFVFYGGFIFSFLAVLTYVYWKKLNFWKWTDFWAPIISFGYGFGRISCFLAGCCYGKICELPWAIHERHPTQLYAFLWEIGVFIFLISLSNSVFTTSLRKIKSSNRINLEKKLQEGSIFSIWLILHGLGRLMMEYFRDDFRGDPIFQISISSWISLILVLKGASLLFYRRSVKK